NCGYGSPPTFQSRAIFQSQYWGDQPHHVVSAGADNLYHQRGGGGGDPAPAGAGCPPAQGPGKPGQTRVRRRPRAGRGPGGAAPGGAGAWGGGAEPVRMGQFGPGGAYSATPNGKKVCFALAKPPSSKTNPPNRPRDPAYAFVSTRPAEKVSNEVSIMIGYALK